MALLCAMYASLPRMARPYGDPVEIVTAPIPIVLLPGFEYRMLEWRHPNTHEIHWRLERRKSAQHADDE